MKQHKDHEIIPGVVKAFKSVVKSPRNVFDVKNILKDTLAMKYFTEIERRDQATVFPKPGFSTTTCWTFNETNKRTSHVFASFSPL